MPVVLPLITALSNLDANLRQASLALGAGHWRTFTQVTLPLSMPGVIGGASLVLLMATGAIVTPLLLGGLRRRDRAQDSAAEDQR
mgnify:CR=1 FL=1